MAKLIETTKQGWQPVRPELTAGVTGKLLLDGPTKIVLTKVEPGGAFRTHRDNHGHLFHILSGECLFQVEAQEYRLTPGLALQIEAGELHSYKNTGEERLHMTSVNLPVACA